MKACATGLEKPTHQAPVENALLMRMTTQYIRIASCLRVCEETLKNQRSDTHPQKTAKHDATTSIQFTTPVLLPEGAQEEERLTFEYSHEYDQRGPRSTGPIKESFQLCPGEHYLQLPGEENHDSDELQLHGVH